MVDDVLRVLQRSVVLKVRTDAGRPQGVIADLGFDAGKGGARARTVTKS